MLSITFTVTSMQDLEAQFKAFMGIAPAETPEKRGPGRPKSIPIDQPTQALPEKPAPVAPKAPVIADPFADDAGPVSGSASPVKATFDDMKAALQSLAAKKPGDKTDAEGLKRVSDMLSRFGCKKVKEVKPENYADVITRCGHWAAA